jgi:hypothetical protein
VPSIPSRGAKSCAGQHDPLIVWPGHGGSSWPRLDRRLLGDDGRAGGRDGHQAHLIRSGRKSAGGVSSTMSCLNGAQSAAARSGRRRPAESGKAIRRSRPTRRSLGGVRLGGEARPARSASFERHTCIPLSASGCRLAAASPTARSCVAAVAAPSRGTAGTRQKERPYGAERPAPFERTRRSRHPKTPCPRMPRKAQSTSGRR